MIIVTGGAGFIGSVAVWRLNQEGRDDLLVVDRLGTGPKWKNLAKRRVSEILHKDMLFDWLKGEGAGRQIEAVIHMGASSSTTERDVDYLVENNFRYSMHLWRFCAERRIPYIYASSAATYGDGKMGFSDDPQLNDKLVPMNPYGFSKHKFDQWALAQREAPPFWAGLKFFNVYGPQEYHKGGQTSVAFQLLQQVKERGSIRLFKSYLDGVPHGEQKRDFVYVKDVVDVIVHLLEAAKDVESGIYNVGTGKARSFADLGRAVLATLGASKDAIEYVDMPEGLRNQYQYFTEADLTRLRSKAGYDKPFTSLEDGVRDYLRNYLDTEDPYL